MAGKLRIIEEIFAWGIGLAFIYAGAIKLISPGVFLTDIESYRLVPYTFAVAASLWLPPLELICGLGVLIPRLRLESAIVIGGLMAVFSIALISAWARGLDISCGCFGRSEVEANYPLLLARDALILFAAAGAAHLFARRRSKQGFQNE